MINIYDGNNVMYRNFESFNGQKPLSLRMRYENVMAAPVGSEIWVWDGYAHNERRREIYPQYKANRPPKPEQLHAQIRLFRDCLKHSPAIQVEVHGWEADDVIATLATELAANQKRCTIHTNDMDYGQLLRLGNVTLNGVNLKGIDPRWICLYKAMNGDSSDNIDGIPNFGPKRFAEMAEYWPQIERAIAMEDAAGFVGLPFKPAVAAWLAVDKNVKELAAMLHTVHMHKVPDDEIRGGMVAGRPDRAKASALLSEFFL